MLDDVFDRAHALASAPADTGEDRAEPPGDGD
jgi:hypothetical protein